MRREQGHERSAWQTRRTAMGYVEISRWVFYPVLLALLAVFLFALSRMR